jgi:hypothetical protein
VIEWMKNRGDIGPECNKEVYHNGEVVAVITGPRPWFINAWVEEVRKITGNELIDWHFVGGRAVVRCVGDVEKAREVVGQLLPQLREFAAQKLDNGYELQGGIYKDGVFGG